MGDFRPYTKAELEQIERDQQDPKWLEWISSELMESQLRTFLTETLPDMPGNPWSAEGLDRAERAALERFTSITNVDLPQNSGIADQFTRFIGEVFVRNFEGEWFNVPDYHGDRYSGFGPVVREDWTEAYLDVANLITAAVHRKIGTYWSGIFARSEQTYKSWVRAGRPPLDEWMNMPKP
ncbi:hypothetical protein ACWDSJ_32635 [Nocardia sp. NPDC003482]